MSETAPSPPKSSVLALGALEAAALPEAVQKLIGSPTPVKLMAAKGIAAMRPTELLIALYQLSFDADAAVSAAAQAAPGALPDKVVAAPLGEPLPAPVLHFFAVRLDATRVAPLEKVLYNQTTADETFVALAGRLAERELEIIFENEQRMLRCPAILHTLYFNPQARMSSVNRAIELCARNGIRLEGIPAYDEIVKSIAEDRGAVDPAVADQSFSAVLEAAETIAAHGGEPAGAVPEEAPESGAQEVPEPAKRKGKEPEEKKKSAVINFSKLKLYEKIRLATLGNEYCRTNLIRDPNRLVAMAAIRSPKITDGEIVKAAGNRAVSEDVLRYIAGQRDLVKVYAVKLSLVQNPKCPVGLTLKMLPFLLADDLKTVAKSRNVPSALATTAKKLVATRGGGG